MENQTRKHILILMTNQFAILNLVHTGFFKRLADQYAVTMLSDLISEDELQRMNKHFNMSVQRVEVQLPRETRLLRTLRRIGKLLFFGLFRLDTHRIKLAQHGMLSSFLYQLMQYLIPRRFLKVALRATRKLIIHLSARLHEIDFNGTAFDGVISSSPLDIRENIVVNALSARNGIPSLGIVISWDNLTSKGMINADFGRVIVWNKWMADEMKHLYAGLSQVPAVSICGVPRFDIYFDEAFRSSIERKDDVDPGQKVILFATSAPRHFPGQRDIALDLLAYCRQRGCMLLIKCHPLDRPDNYRDLEEDAHVSITGSHETIGSQDIPSLDFLETLAETIYHCDVCVQVASTMRLDAAACNKPVISIAYDGAEKLPYPRSVRRLYDYSHQLPLNKLGIDFLVYSQHELFTYLDKLLSEDFRSGDLRNAIKPLIHFTEPVSVSSMLQCVDEWLA